MTTTWSPVFVRKGQVRRRLLPELPWSGVAVMIGVLLVWQALAAVGIAPASSLPSAWEVLQAWVRLVVTGGYWAAVGHTLLSAMVGLGLVVLIGTVLGLMIGRVRFFRESTWFLLEFLKPVPPVAMIPLALLLWGPTETMKLALVTYGALWPYLTQIVYGVQQVDSTALRMSRSYRLGGWTRTRHVVIPSLLPFASTGVRVSAAIAIVVTVVTELVGGAPGVGRSLVLAQSANEIAEVYALILTTGVLGVIVNAAFRWGEKPLLFWHPSQRSGQAS